MQVFIKDIHGHVMQGDISILKVDKVPDSAKLVELKKHVVSEGESSNHFHTVVADEGSDCRFYRDGENVWLEVLKGTASLHHWIGDTQTKADHEPFTVGEGTYRLAPQWEYDELADKKVID